MPKAVHEYASESSQAIELTVADIYKYEPNLQFARTEESGNDLDSKKCARNFSLSVKFATDDFLLLDAESEHYLLDANNSASTVAYGAGYPVVFFLDGERLHISGNQNLFFGAEEPWIFCDRDGELERITSMGEFSSEVFFIDKLDPVIVGEFRWQLLCGSPTNDVRGLKSVHPMSSNFDRCIT